MSPQVHMDALFAISKFRLVSLGTVKEQRWSQTNRFRGFSDRQMLRTNRLVMSHIVSGDQKLSDANLQ